MQKIENGKITGKYQWEDWYYIKMDIVYNSWTFGKSLRVEKEIFDQFDIGNVIELVISYDLRKKQEEENLF